MSKQQVPFIILALSIPLLGALVYGSQPAPDRDTRLPLLALLAISELGIIANAAGAVLALRRLLFVTRDVRQAAIAAACILLTWLFLRYLILFWPF
jgi:hypothetical protein